MKKAILLIFTGVVLFTSVSAFAEMNYWQALIYVYERGKAHSQYSKTQADSYCWQISNEVFGPSQQYEGKELCLCGWTGGYSLEDCRSKLGM